jgi:hypothetical protein
MMIVNDKLERIFEGSGHDIINTLSQHLPGRTEEKHEKPQ